MAGARDIKKRIKSIGNTKKITRAMEMVSAAKMRKAIEAVLRTRSYANLSWATVLNLARANGQDGRPPHPLLDAVSAGSAQAKRGGVKKVAVVLITSNRGLCGGFNSVIIKKVLESIRKHSEPHPNPLLRKEREQAGGVSHEFILLGKKGQAVYKNFNFPVTADFPKLDYINEVGEVIPVARMIIKDYLSGQYDKVMVAYTDFINAAKQLPRVKQLLPIDITTADEYLGVVGQDPRLGLNKELIEEKEKKHLQSGQFKYEYIFEPSPEEVLNEMLPRLIEIQLFQALLESNASEQSARRLAMHQATEAATDMAGEVTLSYNKARQAGVTSEIAEISAGANALAE